MTSINQVVSGRYNIVYVRMTYNIVNILLFELFLFLFNPELDLRSRVVGSLSRGLPYFGAVLLPRGLPSFDARCFRWLQGGGVISSTSC